MSTPAVPRRAVIFDFDGVLADTERLHLQAAQDAIRPRGWTLDERTYFDRYLGYGDRDLMLEIARDLGERLNDAAVDDLLAAKALQYRRRLAAGRAMYPTAAACIQRLGARFPLGIASGSLRDEIRDILDAAGLRPAFQVIVGADDCTAGKPAPEPYARAAAALGVQPERAIAIEDSKWGLESARGAGLKTVGITTTYAAGALGGADAIITSLDELTIELVERVLSS